MTSVLRSSLRRSVRASRLHKWVRRFEKDGVAGLATRAGDRRTHLREQNGDRECCWIFDFRRRLGSRRIQSELRRAHDFEVSRTTIDKVLTAADSKPLSRLKARSKTNSSLPRGSSRRASPDARLDPGSTSTRPLMTARGFACWLCILVEQRATRWPFSKRCGPVDIQCTLGLHRLSQPDLGLLVAALLLRALLRLRPSSGVDERSICAKGGRGLDWSWSRGYGAGTGGASRGRAHSCWTS